MSPLPQISYNKRGTHSFLATSPPLAIPRHDKQKSKSAHVKYGSQTPCKGKRQRQATFQRKITVFNYMGSEAPSHFTRKDSYILMRGLLPDMSLEADEKTVRQEIADIINHSKSFGDVSCSPYDFEFIDVNGKHATIPNVKEGLEFTGKAVKNLAGSGSVHVRMKIDVKSYYAGLCSSNSDEDPIVHEVSSSDNEDKADFLPSIRRKKKFQKNAFSGNSGDAVPRVLQSAPPCSSRSSHLNDPEEGCSRWFVTDTKKGCSSSTTSSQAKAANESLVKLCEILGVFSFDDINFVFQKSGQKFDDTLNCMLEGPSLESICQLLNSQLISDDVSRIKVDACDDVQDWVDAAFGYYKSSNWLPSTEVRIIMRNQSAIDTGGVRRQFFTAVFQEIACSGNLFEGTPESVRPAFKMSNLSSGIFQILGTMIAHNLVLDCQGFPFLSECIYYTLAGQTEKAMTLITMDDLSENVKTIIQEVSMPISVCTTIMRVFVFVLDIIMPVNRTISVFGPTS